MIFEDEHYVRSYTRDTKTWIKWGWEGQTVFMHVHRKLDKAGILDDIDDAVDDIALITKLPREIVAVGLPRLLESETLIHIDGRIVMPKYIEGATAVKSDANRAREYRERRRASALSGSTSSKKASRNVMDESQKVTDRHAASHAVTERHAGVTTRAQACAPALSCNDQISDQDPHVSEDTPPASTARQSQPPPRLSVVQPSKLGAIPDGMTELQHAAQRILSMGGHAQNARFERGEPNRWPEIVRLIELDFELRGVDGELPRTGSDGRVKRILERYSEGFTPEELEDVLQRARVDEHWGEIPLHGILKDPANFEAMGKPRRRAANDSRYERSPGEPIIITEAEDRYK